jgi:hypothetical protein
MSNQIARQIGKRMGEISQEKLKQVLRSYKREKTQENFEAVLRAAGLGW